MGEELKSPFIDSISSMQDKKFQEFFLKNPVAGNRVRERRPLNCVPQVKLKKHITVHKFGTYGTLWGRGSTFLTIVTN